MQLYCLPTVSAPSTTSHTTSLLLVFLSPVHLLVYEQSSEGSLKITSEREATGAYVIRLLYVWHLKNDERVEKKTRCVCVCGR